MNNDSMSAQVPNSHSLSVVSQRLAPINIALIGAGRWGKRYLDTFLTMNDTLKLIGIASSKPEISAIAPNFCKVYPHWHELLANRQIEGIVIASPPHTHNEILLHALKHQIPCIVEKPVTMNRHETYHLHEQFSHINLPILVNHIYLFHGCYEAIIARVQDLGMITNILTYGGNWGPFRPPEWGDFSSLWDYGPHDLSLILSVTKKPPYKIKCQYCRMTKRGQPTGDIYKIDLTFASGQKATSYFGNGFNERKRTMQISGSKGILEFSDSPHYAKLNSVSLPFDPTPPLQKMLTKFSTMIRNPSQNSDDLQIACWIADILAECERQIKIGSQSQDKNMIAI